MLYVANSLLDCYKPTTRQESGILLNESRKISFLQRYVENFWRKLDK